MASVQNPPYQDPQGSQRWADWFRDIKLKVEGVTTSISFVDDVTVAGAETDDFLVWTTNGLWENQTSAQAVEALNLDSDDTVTFDVVNVESVGTVEIDLGGSEIATVFAAIEHDHVAAEITDLSIDDNSDVDTEDDASDRDLLVWDDAAEVWEDKSRWEQLYHGLGSYSFAWSDFLGPAGSGHDGPFALTVSGAAAGINAIISAGTMNGNHPGVWSMTTGTTTTGRCFILSSYASGSYKVGSGIIRIGTWVKTDPSNLSDGTDRYMLRSGLFNMSLPNTINNGIGFEYVDNENSGNWQAITHNGTETTTDTGVTVAANTWYKLEIEINAAGTSVEFFIDGVSVATNTTNIPASTVAQFYNTHIMKLLGTTPRFFSIDAAYMYSEISR